MKTPYFIKKLKLKMITFYYKLFYNLNVGLSINTSIYPATGRGKYVSVYQKGEIIQIIDEQNKNNEIRIIPTKYNHGIFIEKWEKNNMIFRTHLNIEQLGSHRIYMGHVENE